VAVDNARLFVESQQALEVMRRASAQLTQEAWGQIVSERTEMAYRSTEHGLTDALDVWRPEMEQAVQAGQTVRLDGDGHRQPLAVPIKVRGKVVGVLDTYKSGAGESWTPMRSTPSRCWWTN